jgi:Porin subfamily
MKKVSKFNAAVALGSLTAAVALLAGVTAASAQTAPGSDDATVAGQAAPGGGSFPGSFLIPGTNTSLKIGGIAKWDMIYDMAGGITPDTSQVLIPFAIPLNGSAGYSLHGDLMNDARQSNFSFDARTPTSYGELDVFALMDFFGQQTTYNVNINGTDSWTQRMVYFYGSLGPLMAGQTPSLWFDGDSLPEVVDPTPYVGQNDGLSNRHTTIRYTYAGAGGFSAAFAVEQPNPEGFSAASGATFQAMGLSGGWVRVPDFLGKVSLYQGWGHVSAALLVRDQDVLATGTRFSKTTVGGHISGSLNTFGKDVLRGSFMVGTGLGSYLSDMGSNAGLQVSSTTGSPAVVAAPLAYGLFAGYTHWWTDELRSSVMAGWSHVDLSTSAFATLGTATAIAAAENGLDKRHIGTTANLIWSPVPQVDLGLEYSWVQRETQSATAFISNTGALQRIETMVDFKF